MHPGIIHGQDSQRALQGQFHHFLGSPHSQIEILVLQCAPDIALEDALPFGDEFPARSQILFDDAADKHFALDVVWAM